MQEDDLIGLLASDDIAQLKPLGDRILIAVSPARLQASWQGAGSLVHDPACICHMDSTQLWPHTERRAGQGSRWQVGWGCHPLGRLQGQANHRRGVHQLCSPGHRTPPLAELV